MIAFRCDSTEVMHRVSEITDKGLILKPDNGEGESLVTKDMYVGKEIIAFPFIGTFLKIVLQQGRGIVLLAAVALIVVGCWSRKERKRSPIGWRKKKKDSEDLKIRQ